MSTLLLRARLIALLLVPAAAASVVLHAQASDVKAKGETRRAALSLKASPLSGMAPVRIYVTAELKGGRDDDEDLYCTTVAWDWGDGTVSESTADCEPFQPGKTTIQRRYAATHLFREPGRFQVSLRLKKKDRTVVSASTTVQITGAAPLY